MRKGIRKEVYCCEAYVSGKSMDEVKEQYGLEHVVKLGSNENPYAPYDHALERMIEEVKMNNIYPEKNFIRLKDLLGEKFGVTGDYIGIGHGAGGVIETVAKTLLEEGDEVFVPQQSYRLYPEVSKIMGAKVVEIPLTEDFKMNFAEIKRRLSDSCKLIWLCNPNNPTGSLMDLQEFDELIKCIPENTWVVLDEAYAEFAPKEMLPDTIKYIKEHKNLICIRTFSKYYGLAGGRIGYLIASPEVVNLYDTVSEPFNANRIGLAGAVATLNEDKNQYEECGEKMIEARSYLNEELAKCGCTPFPSYANFVFFETPHDASTISQKLLEKGVIVRSCAGWGYDNFIRMSIGTSDDNETFLKEFKNVLAEI